MTDRRPALAAVLLLMLPLALSAPPVRAETAADRLARWQPHVAEASQRFGVPETWIRRVIQAESAGRTEQHGRPIRSRVGAMGLMQLMPGTWAAMRSAHGLGSDPDDPRDNILAGTAYLRVMYDRFGYPGCFAAYNAGPARYAGYLAGRSRLPGETRAYLAQVTSGNVPVLAALPVMPMDMRREAGLFAVRRGAVAEPVIAEMPASASGLFALRRQE